MFEDREPSIFPHAASAWWIPILLALGWGPLYIADILYSQDGQVTEGFGMPWGMAVALPCTLAAELSVLVQACRLFTYFINRPKPISK
jgi:hypothetical protein